MYNNVIKRLFDIVLSLISLILLSPIFLLILIAIRLDSDGSAIFTQTRIGRYKKPFQLYKFRTMYISAPKSCPTCELKNPHKYITRVGKILRKTSLDELPQLFNVLKGEMSLIGPRPIIPEHDVWIALRDKGEANNVRPGITGWAQINGRDEISDEEKAMYDNEYAKNLSFTFDLRCFFKSIFVVLKKEGIREGTLKQNTNDTQKRS